MKYIIVSDGILEQEVIFSEGLTHSDVYKYSGQIRSAGFCSPRSYVNKDLDEEQIVWRCWGGSESLGIKSRGEEDEKILNRSSRQW